MNGIGDSSLWLNLIGSGGVAVIIVSLIKVIENRFTLKSSKPKVDAEAADIGIGSQKRVIETLNAENKRLSDKLTAAETKADEREQRLNRALDDARAEFDRRLIECQHDFAVKLREYKEDNEQLRTRVEALLVSHDIAIPAWWDDGVE